MPITKEYILFCFYKYKEKAEELNCNSGDRYMPKWLKYNNNLKKHIHTHIERITIRQE